MGSSRLTFVAFALGVFVCGAPFDAAAQDFETPAHVSYAEGLVTVERDGESDEPGAGWVLVPGDRLRTKAGRVEVLFPDGSALYVDEYTVLDLLDSALLRLGAGRVILAVSGAADPGAALRYQVDTASSSINTEGPGEYRLAVSSFPSGAETELSVVRGFAVIGNDHSSVRVRSGEQSTAREGFGPSFPRTFNAARYDDFDLWAAARRDERMGYVGGSSSALYLPADLRMYGGTLDRHGAWQHEPSYGYVWYPTVAPLWRPYYHGSWISIRGYGWTWAGGDRWAWPTHHYGRWGHSYGRWFWIPGRKWGPAWVSWGAAPGYVGWCPLGFNNRPVFAMSPSVGNRWNGWVAVPRKHFGAHGAFVHREAVYHPSFETTPFVTQASAPVAPPRAVPRNSRAQNGSGVETQRPGPGSVEVRRPGAQPSAIQSATPGAGARRPTAASRNPRQVPSEPTAAPGGSAVVVGRASPGRAPSSGPALVPERAGAVPRGAPSTERGFTQEFPRRSAPGEVTAPSGGVATRRPTEAAPEPQEPPISSGVIRTNPNPGGSFRTGNGGIDERSRAVRRAPPPAAAPAPAAGYPREAPPRQPPAGAPSGEAAAPAASSSTASAPSRRGPGSSDSGRARRR